MLKRAYILGVIIQNLPTRNDLQNNMKTTHTVSSFLRYYSFHPLFERGTCWAGEAFAHQQGHHASSMATNERGTASDSHWGTSSHRCVNIILFPRSRTRRRIVLMALLLPFCCYFGLPRLLLSSIRRGYEIVGGGEGVYDLTNSDQDRKDLPEKGTGQVMTPPWAVVPFCSLFDRWMNTPCQQ